MPEVIFLPPGAFRSLIILGVARYIPELIRCIGDLKIDISVFLSRRQASVTTFDGLNLVDSIRATGVSVTITDMLDDCPGGPFETDPTGAVILSLGSPYIIRQSLLERYDGRVINSHGAPLPEWRGGGGFSWRIMAGDKRGVTCVHLVTEGIDDGDLILRNPYLFPHDARLPRDYMRIAEQYACHDIDGLLRSIARGDSFPRISQDEGQSSYFPRLHTATHGIVDWSWPGAEIERFILAFSHPYEGARTTLNGLALRLFDAHFIADAKSHSFFAGLVIRRHACHTIVACRDGLLEIPDHEIVHDGKVRVGDRFFSTPDDIAKAYAFRAIYTPTGLKV